MDVAGKVPPADSDQEPVNLSPAWLQLPQAPYLAHLQAFRGPLQMLESVHDRTLYPFGQAHLSRLSRKP